MTTTIRITYGDDMILMQWDGAQAAAPILADGEHTGYQTADARHRTSEAVRLVAERAWGPLYETCEAAEADGRSIDSAITIWDDLTYETVEETTDATQD